MILSDIPLPELQDKTQSLFFQLHDFFEAHGLSYVAIAGTMLGAVRHQGFIPWDDDVDLAMPRADFDRLRALRDALPAPLVACWYDNDPKHVFPYLRIYDSSTAITIDYVVPFTRGVWIDICPIDGTFDNRRLRGWHLKTLFLLRSLISNVSGGFFKKTLPAALQRRYRIYGVVSRLLGKSLLVELHQRVATLRSPKPLKMSGTIVGMLGHRDCFTTELYTERALYPFGGRQIYGPRDYHRYLTQQYGDYMTLPPEDKRFPTHGISYLNLSQPFSEIDPLPRK